MAEKGATPPFTCAVVGVCTAQKKKEDSTVERAVIKHPIIHLVVVCGL